MIRGLGLIAVLLVVMLAARVLMLTPEPIRVSSGMVEAIPDFMLVDGMTDEVINRGDIIGEKFLLNVWATWCVACREEHDFLMVLANQDVPILGLYYRDAPQSAIEWLETKGNPYRKNVLDTRGMLADKFPVRGAPETYFIDRYGYVVYRHSGIINAENWANELSAIYQSMN
ncbi:DsbE family thiol:disulfide interchange protein [Eionea flava]